MEELHEAAQVGFLALPFLFELQQVLSLINGKCVEEQRFSLVVAVQTAFLQEQTFKRERKN